MAILALTTDSTALAELAADLPDLGLEIESAIGPGLRRLEEDWSLVLLDSSLEVPVLPLLERLAQAGRRVAVMSRQPTLQLTLDALGAGARDVMGLPPDATRLRELVESCAPGAECGEASPCPDSTPIIGRSRALLDAFRTVARVSNSSATVLIRGESGTGKELLARVLHDQSSRASRPFVAVNCAAIPENLLESELFGHEKGAFTGALGRRIGRIERASGGTLFLDEIGDMSLALQAKMLRALQEREVERVGGEAPVRVDVRVIAATNRNLEDDVAAGRFREDLYYRLAVVPITLPPLRARGEDVELLAAYFLKQAATEFRRPVRRLDPAVLDVLRRHAWPGNVRQLRNAIERAVLMAEGPVLRVAHLPADVRDPAPRPILTADEYGTLADLERHYIQRVLDRSGGHMARAAQVLGIHRNTLRRKLEAYGLA